MPAATLNWRGLPRILAQSPKVNGSPTLLDMFKTHLRRECLMCAVLAVVLGSAWQITLVYSLYGGNWSALFYHGTDAGGVPNEPAFQNTYVFPDGFGFDGQYYRIIAHDPFLTRGYIGHIDMPMMRYRRILVPLMAFALACGRQPYIDAGFIATMLLFFFLGVYWLGGGAAVGCGRAKGGGGWRLSLPPP